MLGGACVTEELWPGQRVSRASYVVSMLQPKIVSDLRLHDFGYEAVPLDPSYATFGHGRQADLLLLRHGAHAGRARALLQAGRRRLPRLRGRARPGRGVPAPAAAPPAARARVEAAGRPARAAARGRPRRRADEAGRARAVPRDDDARGRPARRLVRDRCRQGHDRIDRRGGRLGGAADARHRLQPAPPRARRAERHAGRVGPREGRHGRDQPGARAQRRGARRDGPHRRARCARSTSRDGRITGVTLESGEEVRAPLVDLRRASAHDGARPRRRASTSRTRSATTCAASAAAAAR